MHTPSASLQVPAVVARPLFVMLLLMAGSAACDDGGGGAPPVITFTHHLVDVRGTGMEETRTPLLTGFDSRGTPVVLGGYELIGGELVDRVAAARPGRVLRPELCLEQDPLYPWSGYSGWPAVVLDGADGRVQANHVGRYLTAERWWFETRRDWDASDLISRDFGQAILYGASAAFVTEAAFPFFLVTDYFDQTTSTAKVTVFSVQAPDATGVEDLGTFDGMGPMVAYVPEEDSLYLAHRTLHEPCALRRHDGTSWDQVVGPQISAGGACVGLAVSADGALVMVARNLPTAGTTELRAYRREGNGWVDAGRIGPESDGQLLGVQVGRAGDGLVVSHTDPEAGVAFWLWDGASTWTHLARVGSAGLTRVSWTSGAAQDLLLAFIDGDAGNLPRLMRLPLDGAPEDLGTVGATPAEYTHLTRDPADRRPIVLAVTEGSEHPHAFLRETDGTLVDLGSLPGAGDAPLLAVPDEDDDLAFFQFSARCSHIRKEDVLFHDVQCLGWAIPDEDHTLGYLPMSDHWLALTADDRPVLAVTDQSQGGVPVVFRIEEPGVWTSLGRPGDQLLPQDSQAELHLVVAPNDTPTVLILVPDLSDPLAWTVQAGVYAHAGEVEWTDLEFTPPAGAEAHQLAASDDGLFVGLVFHPDPEAGDSQVAVLRHAAGAWKTLGPFPAAGEGASQLRLVADDGGLLYLSYETADTPFSWAYILAAWNGRWHQLGYSGQGEFGERLMSPSMALSPGGLPAIAFLESAEYNLDLWIFVPND